MLAGTLVNGRFVIEREAGSGGMGTVYRAIDRTSGAPVALKVLRSIEGTDAARLAREAALLASFRHPGIVGYVDQGLLAHESGPEAAGSPYLAMEWLDGTTLAAYLAERASPLPIEDALSIVRQAAGALGVAHARGIVHRDIKPGNLFLVDGDPARVKVLDFGIARRVGEQSLSLTASGTVLGTPFYMAPEQARGHANVDARVDVWALGCVLYELLTGRTPFDHAVIVAVLAAILLESPARPSELRSEVPVDLEELVLEKLLAKDPAQRPPDGAALVRALDRIGPIALERTTDVEAPRALTEREQRVVCLVLVEAGVATRIDAPTMQITDPAMSYESAVEARVRSAADEHQGRLEVLANGSILVAVPERGAPTDQAARAARCALAIRDIVPGAGIAIAAGRARIEGRLPVGEVVEAGVRLLALPVAEGSPRPVRVDPIVAGLLEGRFALAADAAGRLLRGPRGEADTARTLLGRASPCVGRDRELSLLEDLWRECAGHPIARCAVLTGAAGAGKTRVITEALARILEGERAPVVLIARGDPLASGSPHALLAQLLRGASEIGDGEPIATAREKLLARTAMHLEPAEARRVAALLGEIARVHFPEESEPALRAARRDPEVRADLVREAFDAFLDAETEAGPVLIVLDDLQYGDRPSLSLIDGALGRSSDRALMVIAAGRPELADAFPGLFEDREPQQIRIGRLVPRAARQLIDAALARPIEEEAAQRLIERADGNPFFLEELIRAHASGATDELPTTVLAMVEMRLHALDAEARRVLRAASVFGMRASREGIAALLGGTIRPAVLDERLRELVQRELLAIRGDKRGAEEAAFSFRSALVREAAYATLTADDRALGHRLAGRHLEHKGEPDPAVLAEHFDRGGDRERAELAWSRAALLALDGNDLGGARARAERGLAIASSDGPRGVLLRVKAAVHRWKGEYLPALALAREAIALAEVGSLHYFDTLSIVIAATGRLRDGALTDTLLSMVAVEPGADAVGAQVVAMCRTAAIFLARGDRGTVETLLGRAEQLAERAPEERVARAWIEVMRASCAFRDGDVSTYITRTEAAVAWYERASDARDACNQRVRLGNGWMSLGEAARAEPVLRAALLEAERLGLPLIKGYALQNLGHALAEQHKHEEARAALAEAIEIGERLGDRVLDAGSRIYRADIALARGKAVDAIAELDVALDRIAEAAELSAVALASRARALVALGEAEGACIDAERARDILGGREIEEGGVRIQLALIEAYRAVGRESDAKALAREARAALEDRAARITSEVLRRSFLHQVPEHAALLRHSSQ